MLDIQTFITASQKFLDAFLLEVIIVLLFSGGIMSFILEKIKSVLYGKRAGISRIYKKGKDIKSIQESIAAAQSVCILGFVPNNFVFDNRILLTEAIKNGCKINILHCSYNSPVLKELSQIDNGTDLDVANNIQPLENQLRRINSDAGTNSTGYFEIRKCFTEIRNPCIICQNKKGHQRAFLTVSLPPKRSIDSIMLEFRGKHCNDVAKYFNTIWERHSQDSIRIG